MYKSRIIAIMVISLTLLLGSTALAKKNVIDTAIAPDGLFSVAKTGTHGQMLDVYRLSKYDVINLLVIGFPDGIGVNDILVGPDGYAQLPYVGMVKLAGLTIDEATELLRERLGEYIRIPQLSVMMKSYGPRRIQVVGEVKNPGIIELSIDSMNVFAAVSSAGGVDTHGRPKHIQILRAVGDKLYYMEVDLDAYVKRHDMKQNIVLEDGDIVYVPRSNKIDLKTDILPYISIYGTYKSLTD